MLTLRGRGRSRKRERAMLVHDDLGDGHTGLTGKRGDQDLRHKEDRSA